MSSEDRHHSIVAKNGRSRRTTILLTLAIVFSIAGTIAAYALYYPVLLSDTVSLMDQTTLRQTTEDSLDLGTDPSQSNPARDDLGALDSPASSTDARDALEPSDSAQALSSMFYQVAATSVLGLSDSSSSGSSARDDLQLQDGDSLQSPVQDALSVLDSTARMLFVYITDSLNLDEQTGSQHDEAKELEVERVDNRGGSGKPDRKVYDSSYFTDRPLGRTEVTSIDIRDPQGNVPVQLKSGQDVVLSVGLRNYQSVSQGYAMFVQITDKNDVAVEIIEIPGSIDDGEYTRVDAHWTTERGTFSVKVFMCDDAIHPTVISESLVKTVVVD